LRWFGYPFPIYSLAFGYISIANMGIQELINSLKGVTKDLHPYSEEIAGPALIFALSAIPFYWILILMFENKVFDVILCKKAKKQQQGESLRRISVAGSMYGSVHGEDVDPDVTEEEQRVASIAPENLPVRVNQIRKMYGKVVGVDKVSFGLEYGECFALLGISGAGKTSTFKCLTGETYPSNGEITINGYDVTSRSGF